MADAEHPVRRDRLQFELDLVEKGEGALGADQQPRHVVAAARAVAVDRVDVVAADPAQHLRKAARDFVGFAPVQSAHPADEVAIALGHRVVVKVIGHRAEPCARPVGEQCTDAAHVVNHVAVAQRARTAAVVGGHAAERGAARGRGIDRKEQFVLPQPAVQPVEDHARFDPRPPRRDIDRNHLVHMPAAIDDEGAGDGLPALRGAGAARQDRHPFFAGDRDRRRGVGAIARDDDAQRLDLVDRRIG